MPEEIDIRTEIVKLLEAEPFSAFSIAISSGQRYEVSDAHAAAVGKQSVIVVPRQGAGHSVLPLNQISSLDVLEPA